jgi:phytanoyl-CoA hydroxylase
MNALGEFTTLRDDFRRDGFVTVPQFLAGDELRTLTENLDRYIRDIVPTLPDSDAFYVDRSRPETLKQMQHMEVDPFFRDYVHHPHWLALAEALLAEPVRCRYPEWFNKPPGEEAPTPPHQDNYYFCLEPAQVVTIWLALDPVDEDNGCLRYVRGSHLEGIRSHGRSSVLGFSQGITDYGPKDEARAAKICLRIGDATVHHGNTIHRAEPNRTAGRHRRAFAMVIEGASCRRDEEAYARYVAALKCQHESMGLATCER